MKTIKNFKTSGENISFSFTMADVNGPLPIKTEVWLNTYADGKFIDEKITSSKDNTGNIPKKNINSSNGILTILTSLVYENEETLPEMISELDLSYKIILNGKEKEYKTSDSTTKAATLRIVKIIKTIELS